MTFDPFGDFETRGYLRNVFGEKDLAVLKDLENIAFTVNIDEAVKQLAVRDLNYEAFKLTHRVLFSDLYPWAGEDRAKIAPDIAITRAGYKTIFCHPASVKLASDYALRDIGRANFSAGNCFAGLAHAHPFLDGNGRAILTLHSEIMRRSGKHIEWEKTEKTEFLEVLTKDLENPDQGHFSAYLTRFVKDEPLSLEEIGNKLKNFVRE